MEELVMRSEELQYYQGKKVFVTGHTGFKGGWLIASLLKAGATVRGYALAPEFTALYNLMQHEYSIDSWIGDIRDKNKLTDAIVSFQPDFIFHLAAQPLVRRSYEMPAYTFDVNVTGTANVLESVNHLRSKCTIVVITTDKVYENIERPHLYKESDLLGGYDPYSASKACTELVVSSFRHSFYNPEKFPAHQKAIATARAGNVIGGADWSIDRIFPDIVRSLEKGIPVELRNPMATRPWQFVLEPISGYLRLGKLLDNDPAQYSRSFNFGPEHNDHLTVKELVELAIRNWGNGEWRDISSANQPHESGLLQLDITLAKNMLGWYPKLAAKDAIEWTVEWFKSSEIDKLSMAFKQIDKYFNL